jgi:hypothetical protein
MHFRILPPQPNFPSSERSRSASLRPPGEVKTAQAEGLLYWLETYTTELRSAFAEDARASADGYGPMGVVMG